MARGLRGQVFFGTAATCSEHKLRQQAQLLNFNAAALEQQRGHSVAQAAGNPGRLRAPFHGPFC